MKGTMDIVIFLIKRAGAGVITVFLLLLCSGLSWGDTTVYVYQAATGALSIKTFDTNGNMSTPSQNPAPPKSCFTPDLFWDSGAGALRLNGFDSSNDPSWTGTIHADGKFASTMSLPAINCGSVTPSVVSGVFPESIPCTSYGAWGACSNGLITRIGSPVGCVGDMTMPCSNVCAIACTSWQYGDWIPYISACTPGQPMFRTATGMPPGCSGSPDQPTIQICPPNICTGGWQYSAWNPLDSACTAGQTQTRNAIAGTGSTPPGCTGGTPSTADQTQTKTCSAILCTGGWLYTAWIPSDATCTPGQTQTRSAIAGTIPLGCTGGTLPSDQTKTCPSTVTYQLLQRNCGTGTLTSVANGAYFYSFTVPKGVYSSVLVADQQSNIWSEQVVIEKDGNITLNDYNALMAQFSTNPSLRSLISQGSNNLWYQLKPGGNIAGSAIIFIRNSPDGVITTANSKTTLTRDVSFTMVLRAGDVGPAVPAGAMHRVRYCYQ